MSADSATAPLVPYPRAMKAFPRVRQSHLSAYDNCALSFRFERDTTFGFTYPWQARGRMFHRFAAKAWEEMERQGERTLEVDVGLAILEEVLRQDDVDRQCPTCRSTRIRKGLNRDGTRFCLRCRSRFESEFVNLPQREIRDLFWIVKKFCVDNAWSVENLASIEERLNVVVYYPNPHGGQVARTLTGQLDVLFIEQGTRAIVVDLKDTWKLPPPTELEHDGYFQQRFYGMLVLANYRAVEEVVLREFYVRRSEPREAVVYRHQLDEILAGMAATVERFDRSIEEGLHPATPGSHCGWCPMPQRCPIVSDVRGEGRIRNYQEARAVAAELVVLDSVKKRSTKAMQAWSRQYGDVEVRDAKGRRVYGHRRTETMARPSKDKLVSAIDEARAQGKPLELSELYPKREGTRFDVHPPKADPDRPVFDEGDEEIVAALQGAVERGRKVAGL